jgi:hypothetical protein
MWDPGIYELTACDFKAKRLIEGDGMQLCVQMKWPHALIEPSFDDRFHQEPADPLAALGRENC